MYIYIYIYNIMMPNIKGTDSSIFSTYSTLVLALYFPDVVENNMFTLGLVKEHQVLHSSSPLLATSINSKFKLL